MKDNLEFCEFKSSMEFSGMLSELLSALPFQYCVNDDLETTTTLYRIYYETESEGKELIKVLCENLDEWRKLGIECSEPYFSSIKNEDWMEVWKRYFKVLKITPGLVVKASWLEYIPTGNEKIIEIDPEMSFGTGSHETTQFCMKAIERLSDALDKSFLDAGCGSGILAITAALCGFRPIYAFDNDKESMETTVNNLARNNIKEKVNFSVSDIAGYSPEMKFGVVAANIISGVLIDNCSRLKSWVKPGGYLILAGILKSDYADIKKVFEDSEFTQIFSDTEKEWTGGIFQRQLVLSK